MISAPVALARITSLSVMPPTAECKTRTATSSVEIFSSEPTIASSEPCTSDLTTTGSSLAMPAAICENICSSVPRAPAVATCVAPPALAEIGDLAGPALVVDNDEIVAGERQCR